jgi:hypothetical protein
MWFLCYDEVENIISKLNRERERERESYREELIIECCGWFWCERIRLRLRERALKPLKQQNRTELTEWDILWVSFWLCDLKRIE